MRTQLLNLMLLGTAAASCLSSCQEKEEPISQHPIVGEWKAPDSGSYVQLFLEGDEKTPTTFGMEVFQLNESSAGEYVENYLQNQILGPIDLQEGNLLLTENNTFTSRLANEALEGIWLLYNSESRLRLQAEGLPIDRYGFELIALSQSEMRLKFTGQLEFIAESGNRVHNYEVIIRLIKI
jgi:hypothetical protein